VPQTRVPVVEADQLPEVMTAQELADFERVDVRTLRAALEAGKVPGAYRRGRSWRILKTIYLADVAS
jgi:hypothetical protein